MDINSLIVQPLLLGLSAGLFCVTFCVPFIAPILVSEERKAKENFKVVLKFIFGRLVGYILFGAIFGYLGQRWMSVNFDLWIAIALMFLSLILIFYAIGLLKKKFTLFRGKPLTRFSFCSIKRLRRKTPWLLGFLMGINVCPPFLMAVAYVVTFHSWFKGVIFFLMFFLATTIYFLPLFFLGFLSRMKEFRLIARVSALIVGLMFFIYSVLSIINH